jgi:hypothetical protein
MGINLDVAFLARDFRVTRRVAHQLGAMKIHFDGVAAQTIVDRFDGAKDIARWLLARGKGSAETQHCENREALLHGYLNREDWHS